MGRFTNAENLELRKKKKKTSQPRRAVGNTVSDLTGPGFEPKTSRTDSNVYIALADFKILKKQLSKLTTSNYRSKPTDLLGALVL